MDVARRRGLRPAHSTLLPPRHRHHARHATVPLPTNIQLTSSSVPPPPRCTDTPGLLDRAEADRNAMERLTLACLQHLPTAVLYVSDLTGECGTSVASQWRIR